MTYNPRLGCDRFLNNLVKSVSIRLYYRYKYAIFKLLFSMDFVSYTYVSRCFGELKVSQAVYF